MTVAAGEVAWINELTVIAKAQPGAPIVFPIAVDLGIDPIHLGIIMTINMEIGLVTPPVGLNLFVTAGVAELPTTAVVRAAAPWLLVLLSVLMAITYVPAVSLLLPEWLGWGGN